MVSLEYQPEVSVLEGDLRAFCASAKPDTPILPERRLAEEYALTHATVRKVLSRLLAEGLIYRRQGAGTFVARQRQESTAATIIYVDTWRNLDHLYYVSRLRGVMNQAKLSHLRIQLFDGPPAETVEFYAEVARPETAGVIVPYATAPFERHLRRANPRVAIVSTGYPTVDTTVTHVVVDYQSMGAMAADYLLRQGARHPFAICAHRDSQQAFLASCAAAGVQGETVFVEPKHGDPAGAGGALQGSSADGLAFDDDVIAKAVLPDLQRVPERVVSACNRGADSGLDGCALLEVDGHAMGKTVVRTLHAMIEDGLYHNTIVRVRPMLLARRTG